MTTAANLRDALLALAKPTPKQLPPALAGVFPPGCFIRARTAEEDVLMEKAIARLQPTDDASDYEKGMKAVHIFRSHCATRTASLSRWANRPRSRSCLRGRRS